MRVKGVSKIFVKKDLNHESYERYLFDQEEINHTQVGIKQAYMSKIRYLSTISIPKDRLR